MDDESNLDEQDSDDSKENEYLDLGKKVKSKKTDVSSNDEASDDETGDDEANYYPPISKVREALTKKQSEDKEDEVQAIQPVEEQEQYHGQQPKIQDYEEPSLEKENEQSREKLKTKYDARTIRRKEIIGTLMIIFLSILAVLMLIGAAFVVIIIISDNQAHISDADFMSGVLRELKIGGSVSFDVNKTHFFLYLEDINNSNATIKIGDIIYRLNNESRIDLNKDNKSDLLIKLNSTNQDSAVFYLKMIPFIANNTSVNVTNCTEFWRCSNWSICINGFKNRTCDDFHNCNTTKQRPNLSISCDVNVECTPHVRFYCAEGKNAVHWYDSCSNLQEVKIPCLSNEKCDFDVCVPKECEEMEGVKCKSYMMCKQELVEAEDTDECCLSTCETRLCTASTAKAIANKYINASASLHRSYFEDSINKDCDEDGCGSEFNSAVLDFQGLSSFTYNTIETSPANTSQSLTYDLNFNGSLSTAILDVTNNPLLGGCRVISHDIS